VISSNKATMHELQTVYGTEDLVNFIEILAVDAHNQRLLLDAAKNKAR
jgi:hypothetical protein